jgi:hypothetical protein
MNERSQPAQVTSNSCAECSPCPFCNERPRVVQASNASEWWIVDCVSKTCEVTPTLERQGRQAAIDAWNKRPSSETSDQPSTCKQEGHDWKIKCLDCGETREIPYIHLNSATQDRDANIYSVRDVEALLAVGEAMSRHAHTLKAGDQHGS